MTQIEASGLVPAPREEVFAFLSALENHWALAGRWIEVVSLDPLGTGGRVRMHGPLGLRRTATTRVEATDAPAFLRGTAALGRTCAEVSWSLQPRGAHATRVRLAAVVVRAGALDRVLLRFGGARWMRRVFAAALGHLAARLADRAPATSGAPPTAARA